VAVAQGKVRICRILRRPAKRHFKRKVVLVYGSLEIRFNPCNILFRNSDKIFSTRGA